MKKTIFITCVTRMDEIFSCVAGIDEHNRFVRPIIDYPDERPGIKREFLFSPSGEELVRPLTYVEFEFIEHRPEKPYHTEDWIIDGDVAPRVVSRSNDDASRRILERSVSSSLSEAISKRDRSLVTIKTPFAPKVKIKIDVEGRLSCRFVMKDSAGDWITNARTATAPPRITDAYWLALCKHLYNNGMPEAEIEEHLRSILKEAKNMYIVIGLTREWHKRYWRQVSGVLTVPYWLGGKTLAEFGYDWTDNVQ